jgi:flagellar hook-basal body complex protein FliE
MDVRGIGIGMPALTTPVRGTTPADGDFADLIRRGVAEVNGSQLESEMIQQRALAGENLPPGAVQVAAIKAELALTTMVQIRNKLVEAFQEIRQMQV